MLISQDCVSFTFYNFIKAYKVVNRKLLCQFLTHSKK